MEFIGRRSPVYARGGMVATSQPAAVDVGVAVLRAGGNAADAAVAAVAALAVTEPCSNGIGGDCFALYYEAATGRVHSLNGSGRAPAALTIDAIRASGIDDESLPPFHAHTVTVPGAVAGWCDLLARFGTRPLADALSPAIRLADHGFPVAPITAHWWQRGADFQLTPAGADELLIEGRAPHAGELFDNPGLARALERIATHGATGFYETETADAIVAAVRAAGGLMTRDDLAAHRSTWDEPISLVYRDMRIWECPPNGQGLAALLALGVLSHLDIGPPDSPARHHAVIEALRLAFADVKRYVADPIHTELPTDALLTPTYLTARAALFNPASAATDTTAGSPLTSSDTVYLSVVDGSGNACSFIQSNYMGFGSGLLARGCGFTLQNRGHNFSLDPTHPNALAPNKRPYHTIIPAMATRESDGSLYACLGVMGGFMQPQGHVQVLMALLDDALDPQAALDRPRLCIEPDGGWVSIEPGTADTTLDALRAKGHHLRVIAGHARAKFGRGQIITRDPNGVLCGGSDPRADGLAMGCFTPTT